MKFILAKTISKFYQLKLKLLTPKYGKISIDPKIALDCLGSSYGRKYFAPSKLGPNPILVSGGVGEDVSFDVELITEFNASAFLFDPTPRAIKHMDEVYYHFGLKNNRSNSETGKQDVRSYDLRSVSSKNLTFYKYALLDSPKLVKFYEPLIPSHVSHSVNNIQNQFSTRGLHIEVNAIGPIEVSKLIKSYQINILKLDIEGSEYQYLSSCFNSGIYPDQILIEIDELHYPSLRSRKIAKKIFSLFYTHKYQLIYRDGFNFTYLLEKST